VDGNPYKIIENQRMKIHLNNTSGMEKSYKTSGNPSYTNPYKISGWKSIQKHGMEIYKSNRQWLADG
jgi:hypothetical protein